MINIRFDKSMIFWAEPGVNAEVFIYEAIINELKNNGKANLVITNKKTSTLLLNAKSFGYNLSKYAGKQLKIINTYENNQLSYDEPLIINELSPLIDKDEYGFVSMLKQLLSKTRIITAFTAWPYDNQLLRKLSSAFNNKIYLNNVYTPIGVKNYYSIVVNGLLKHYQYKTTSNGLVNVNNRIIITGPKGSGKSTLIRELSERYNTIDYLSSNFGIDYGVVEFKGNRIELFGTPGESFEQLVNLLGVDSTKVVVLANNSLSKAEEMINKSLNLGFETIIASDNPNINISDVEVVKLSDKKQLLSKLI